MSDKLVKSRLKQKYDTEANWITNNPILLAGELAISFDKDNKYKVGNGVSSWKELAYAKSDLSHDDVINALGYTPPKKDTTYQVATETTDGLMSKNDRISMNKINKDITDIKENGVIDNLPVGSIIHIEAGSEIPEGYEIITEDDYHVPANFVGSNESGKLLDDKLNEIDEHMKNLKNVSYGENVATGTDVKLFFKVLK